MTPFYDDAPVGRPIQAPPLSVRPDEARSNDRNEGESVEVTDASLIDNDPRRGEGLGRPVQAPIDALPLTTADHEHIRKHQVVEEEAEKRRIDELLTANAAMLHLPGFLVHPLAVSFLVGMVALLGLFLLSQVTSTLAALAALPDATRYAGYGALAVLVGVVIFAFGRCVVYYIRFRANRAVPLKSLEELANRTRLRLLVHEKKSKLGNALPNSCGLIP